MDDTFDVEIRSIDGLVLELACTTTTSAVASDCATTRSFALMALQSAAQAGGGSPLTEALSSLAPDGVAPVWDEDFHRAHVGTFVDRTELLARERCVEDAEAWYEARTRRAEELTRELDAADLEATLDREFPRHTFTLRVQVTEARWLRGLSPGLRFGTCGFDAWREEPLRPER